MGKDLEGQYLLLKKDTPVEAQPIWQFFHVLGFFTGGSTFIAG
jgi:hypothetical protein